MTTRYQCINCGSQRLHRQFYVWRDEAIDDDREAFLIDEAEPCEMGEDFYCLDCEITVNAIPVDVATSKTITLNRELAAALCEVPIADYVGFNDRGGFTHRQRQTINKWVEIKRDLRQFLKEETS